MANTIGRDLILNVANRYGLDPDLWQRQIWQESKNRTDLVSPVGAIGPAQIMPATWKQPGFGMNFKGSINDPAANLDAGGQYMSTMMNRYNGDVPRALVAYNAGPGVADKWDGNPANLPTETRDYVQKIYGAKKGGGGDVLNQREVNTLLDESSDPNSNRPVTLFETEEPEGEAAVTFHPGMFLSSLGAALAAGKRGESAAGDLGAIRDRYFKQRAYEEEQRAKERARAALMAMVGEGSSYGQALAKGADPSQVMAAWQQDRSFAHDEQQAMRQRNWDVSDMNTQRNWDLSDRTYEEGQWKERQVFLDNINDENTEGDRAYQTGEREAGEAFQRERDHTQFSYGELSADNADRRQRDRDQSLTAAQRETLKLDREKFQIELDTIQRSAASATQGGIAAKLAFQTLVDKQNDPALSEAVRKLPTSAFEDPSMVGQLGDMMTTTQADIPDKLKMIQEYERRLAAGDTVGANNVLRYGLDTVQKTQVINEPGAIVGNVSPDTVQRFNPDGTPMRDENGSFVYDIATGSKTDRDFQLKEQEAQAAAAAAEQERAAAEADAKRRAQVSVDNTLRSTGSALRALRDAKSDASWYNTGTIGSLIEYFPGKWAPEQLAAKLTPARAGIAFGELSRLKEASETGGALGAISAPELELLENAWASLSNTSMQREDLIANIEHVERMYLDIVRRVAMSDATPEQKAQAMSYLGADSQDMLRATGDAVAPPAGMPTSGGNWSIRKE